MNYAAVISVFWLFLVCLPLPVSAAGYYRYVDDSGTICMTDTLANVPARYRSKAVLVPFEKKTPRKNVAEPTTTSSTISPERDATPVDKPGTKASSFRLNWLFLLLLGAGFSYAALKIERRGLLAHASRFRWAMLCLLVVLAYFFNRDIAHSVTAGIKERIDGLRQTVAEHEERDKKPLKTLSEVIEEKMNEAVK